jgi:hypothetical protein
MPRPCSVCTHPDLEAIDEAIVGRVAYRDIAKRHTVTGSALSISALSRHKQDHLSPSLVRMTEQREDDRAAGLVDQLYGLLGRVGDILTAAEGRPTTALAAVREARSLIESIGRFTGELDDRPTVNVLNLTTSPEFLDVQMRLLRALTPFPEARQAAAAALAAGEPRELTA